MMKRKKMALALGAVLILLLCALMPVMCQRPKVLRVSFPCDAEWCIPYWDQQKTFDIAVNAFQRAYPDYEVRVEASIRDADYSEWLMEQFLQGTEPDVFLISQSDFSLLQERGALKDLTELVDADPKLSEELFFRALWQAGRVDDRSYALPFLCNPQLMAVNDDLLEQKNITPVAEIWTWSELHQKCRLIDSSGNRPIYGLGAYTWEMAAYANGSLLFNRDGSDNDIHRTPAVEAVNFVHHLGNLIHDTAAFEAGNVAFAPIWAIECRKYTEFPTAALKYNGFRWHCAPMPRGPLGRNASQTRLRSVAVGNHTRYLNAAFEFLKILTTCEPVQDSLWETTSAVPALRSSLSRVSAGEGATLSRDTLVAVLEQAVVPFRFSWYEETMVQLNAMIRNCFQQREKLEISLQRVHQDIIDYRARIHP